jgi:hypothetical protein
MTFLDELADELVILFAADPVVYAEYVESVAVMEEETLKAMVRMSVTTWEFRRRLKRIVVEQQARCDGQL